MVGVALLLLEAPSGQQSQLLSLGKSVFERISVFRPSVEHLLGPGSLAQFISGVRRG